ncbi:glycosyltransferase family 4 protein [Polynucleobacter paneuropaeus]|nr:glycosyltransferase family 4 protein [Polynucleobacter paneuropaeus]
MSEKGPLKIGVDASALSADLSGIGRYTLETLSRMVEEGHEWHLYSNRPLKHGTWSFNNIHVHDSKFSWLPRSLWLQIIIPLSARKNSLDLFWSPAHRLPLMLPAAVKKVITIHDLVWKYAPNTMKKIGYLLDRTLMGPSVFIADCVICVSTSTYNDLICEFPNANKKSSVILNGVNLTSPSTLATDVLREFEASDKYILFVGTLEPRKNLERLLEAYALVPMDLRNKTPLVLAGGDGWGIGRNKLTDLIDRLGISKNVKLLGRVTDNELVELYRGALFLAMPSLYEGFGLPLIEAMKFGVPSLTSCVSSMPEIAGEGAVYVDPYDVESISDGLIRMMDRGLISRLSVRSLEIVRKFDWSLTAKETLKKFRS